MKYPRDAGMFIVFKLFIDVSALLTLHLLLHSHPFHFTSNILSLSLYSYFSLDFQCTAASSAINCPRGTNKVNYEPQCLKWMFHMSNTVMPRLHVIRSFCLNAS